MVGLLQYTQKVADIVPLAINWAPQLVQLYESNSAIS